MNNKDQYVRMMHAKLDQWQAEVDLLSARAKQAAAGLRIEYGEQIDSLAGKQALARQKLKELEKSGADAWEDLKTGIEAAWKAMAEGLDSARSRFK
jgi:hypothetical protein